jgi:hypothetical protein
VPVFLAVSPFAILRLAFGVALLLAYQVVHCLAYYVAPVLAFSANV